MDTGLGNFAKISEDVFDEAKNKLLSGVFKEGEIVGLRGSTFKIEKITSSTLILKLLPKARRGK